MAVTEVWAGVDGAPPAGSRLEDGWAPTTPIDDTVFHRAVRALAASTARPAGAAGGRRLRTEAVLAADVGEPAAFWNAATVLRPLGPRAWAPLLDRVEGFFGAPGAARTVELWSPFPTPDLGGRGWQLSGHPPMMWRPAGTSGRRPATGDLEIRRVDDEAALREWATTAVEAFPVEGDPATVASSALLDDPAVHLFTGYVGGVPVGISSTVVTHGTNTVLLVAVRPEARGGGHGEALTWAATLVRPDLPAVLLASDDGRPVYEGMGFLPLVRWSLWLRRVGDPS